MEIAQFLEKMWKNDGNALETWPLGIDRAITNFGNTKGTCCLRKALLFYYKNYEIACLRFGFF